MGRQRPEDLASDDFEIEEISRIDQVGKVEDFKPRILIPQLIFHVTVHLLGLYGGYLFFFHAMWRTVLWSVFLGSITGWGVIVGAHRGYGHRSFKATPALKVILLIWHTIAGQNSAYTWARDHRIHHKYSDTDADPHNAKRGFIFAHVGWLVTTKHPMVIEKGKQIDISDLRADKLLMFQHRQFIPLYIVFGLMLPILVPYYMWGEDLGLSFLVPFCFRYIVILNITWSVNSFAHQFGNKPYDTRIRGVQSKFVWAISMGDGWHNYHHCFPWDYRSSEFGNQGGLATNVIDFFAWLGMAYDLRTAAPQIVHGHAKRHGDGTHFKVGRDVDDEVSAIGKVWMNGLGIVTK